MFRNIGIVFHNALGAYRLSDVKVNEFHSWWIATMFALLCFISSPNFLILQV